MIDITVSFAYYDMVLDMIVKANKDLKGWGVRLRTHPDGTYGCIAEITYIDGFDREATMTTSGDTKERALANLLEECKGQGWVVTHEGRNPLTREEEEIMHHLVEAYNRFSILDQTHHDHQRIMADGIYACQSVIKGRVLAREYPDKFTG